MNKHGVSRRWFTEADLKDFKSGALRTTTDITKTGFELSTSPSPNAIYFNHYDDSKEILFYYFHDTKLCSKHKNM